MLLRVFTEPQQGASYDQQLAVARLAEQLGFDAYFRSDHYLRMGDSDPSPGPTDRWVTLAGLTRETSAIRLGTLVCGRDPASLRASGAVVPCCGATESEFVRRAAAIGGDPGEIRVNGAAGLPAEAAEKIAAYGDAGADVVYLQILDLDDLDHLRLLAAEVVTEVGS